MSGDNGKDRLQIPPIIDVLPEHTKVCPYAGVMVMPVTSGGGLLQPSGSQTVAFVRAWPACQLDKCVRFKKCILEKENAEVALLDETRKTPRD